MKNSGKKKAALATRNIAHKSHLFRHKHNRQRQYHSRRIHTSKAGEEKRSEKGKGREKRVKRK